MDLTRTDGTKSVRAGLGVGCAIGAVALGIVHLVLAGAPPRAGLVNAAALVLGLLLFAGLRGRPLPHAPMSLLAASALLATAQAGTSVDGIARWVGVGPLLIQPAMVLLPAMVVAFARKRSRGGAAAIAIAAIALAAQPDRGMAGALAAAVAGLALSRRDALSSLAAVAALAGFGITLGRADTLPPEPFVEGVITSSFAAGTFAGLAAAGGLALLLAPSAIGWWRGADEPDASLAFGAVWLGVIVAATLGNYPTPVVGYGGSAILGYCLSLAALPRVVRPHSRQGDRDEPGAPPPPSADLRAAFA